MGSERRSEKLKDTTETDTRVRPKRNGDAADTSHANRQLALRSQGKSGGDRAGFLEEDAGDHYFEGVGDQYDASFEVKKLLDAGKPAVGFVDKVTNLDSTRREEVAKRLSDVAKVATGNEVLQVGDLVGVPVSVKIRAALASKTPPTTGALRAHAIELSMEQRIELLDASTRALLESKYTEPAEAIPGISDLGPPVRKHPDIVAWYLKTTPPRAVGLAILRAHLSTDDAAALAGVFNGLGASGWQWALALDAQTAQLAWRGDAENWAALTTQPNVAKHLTSIAPPALKPGNVPGGAKGLQGLVGSGNLDVNAVVDALHDAINHEHYLADVQTLASAPFRERLVAAATIEQLDMILRVLSLPSNTELHWYLDSPHATVEAVHPITRAWNEGSIEGIGDDAKLLTRLMTKFPAAGPTDFFGEKARALYPGALTKPTVRKWCTINAEPRDLLALVAQKASFIAKMWHGVIADGVSADWYKGLGTGVGKGSDETLRMLALNTPDQAASTWLRKFLIGDYDEGKISSEAVKIDAVAYEADASKRFHTGLASDETADSGQRASELSDEDVAKLTPDDIAKLLPRLQDPWLLRNLLRIKPPLHAVLAHANLGDAGLAAYVRMRPASELVEAFADDKVEERTRFSIKWPFETFPGLRDPAVLARVLTRPATMTWLLKHADVGYVMSLLAHPATGRAAAKIFTNDHVALVPEMLHRKEDRAAIEKFAAFLSDPLKSRMESKAEDPALYEEDEEEDEDVSDTKAPPAKAKRNGFEPTDVQARQTELESALALGDLRKGLELVLKEPVSVQNVLAVCRERAHEATLLVGKPENEEIVKKLRAAVEMSPLSLFPAVPYYAYFHTSTSRTWLFEHESAITILQEVQSDQQLMKILVDKLDANDRKDTSIDTWLSHMPKGTALTVSERKLVQRMFNESHTAIAARKLFEIRFGTRPSSTFSKAELKKLWQMLALVPDAHIEMGAVAGFTESKTLGGYSGVYSPGDHRIDIEDNLINAGKPQTMFDQKNEMTHEQLVAAYGFDDNQIREKVNAGEIQEKKTAKGTRYIIQPLTTKLLDATVLHEIGHAVDDMLGNRTELVFGTAHWREFGESDVDELAKDLGGWDRVKPEDQTRIKDAWAVWLNSRADNGLDQFVPDDHPALAEKYKGVGIVDLARKKQAPGIELGLTKGAYTIVSHKYQRFYRVPQKTRDAAPSAYSMTAPAEFFAECYAEYYRQYTGPGTEDQKGGRLAGWIKGWFDHNIDNLQYNPSRTDKGK
jgi:hypothetical protein